MQNEKIELTADRKAFIARAFQHIMRRYEHELVTPTTLGSIKVGMRLLFISVHANVSDSEYTISADGNTVVLSFPDEL